MKVAGEPRQGAAEAAPASVLTQVHVDAPHPHPLLRRQRTVEVPDGEDEVVEEPRRGLPSLGGLLSSGNKPELESVPVPKSEYGMYGDLFYVRMSVYF